MKSSHKIFLNALFIGLLTLTISCGKDDDGDATGTSADLIGTWDFAAFSFEATVDGTDFITWATENLGLTDVQAQEFEKALEANYVDADSLTTTYKEDGTLIIEVDDTKETGKWTKNGNKLTWDPDNEQDESVEFTILTLNATTLILEIEEAANADLDEDGTNEAIVVYVELTFSR